MSIGILARDEAATIGRTLRSLADQTLLTDPAPGVDVEIVVVPNACRDDTAAVAEAHLAALAPSTSGLGRWRVAPLSTPGKPNAWNVFVHELSAPEAEVLVLMDADIELVEPGTLASMVATLDGQPDAWVAVDQPVKDVAMIGRPTPRQRLSLAVSQLSGNTGEAWICGQLYAGRAERLRAIRMPAELTVDDGYLYRMVTTDGLSGPPRPDRVVRAPDASHTFEAYLDARSLLAHERWLVTGEVVNQILFDHLEATTPAGTRVAATIAGLDRDDPGWLGRLVAERARRRLLVPRGLVGRRVRSLRRRPPLTAVALAPLALAATVVDVGVVLAADRHLRRHGVSG